MTKWWIWPLLIVLLCVRPVAAGGPTTGEDGVAGLSREEALRLGEQMYRRGVLPSGEPMQALVQGDIPVDGRMFSCESCHLRSGLGSNEGEVVTLPTNAAELFKPFTMAAEEVLTGWSDVPRSIDGGIRRPAYTEQTLAEALSNGIDPSGREFIPSMPRYALDEREMAIMVFYLKNLAATPSPGVDATTMHLATVISDDLPQALRQAFLATLQSYVDARSGETRQETRRAKESPFFERMMYAPFRRLQLHVWTLKGPRESWDAQLQDYYRQAPVFAILSGMTSGDWAPVHAFCERQRLPCLFPITQLPVISESDWYTLYFSKGYYQEGETVARYLRKAAKNSPPVPIMQVYRDDRAGQALARGFAETWRKAGLSAPLDRPLPAGQPLEKFWPQLLNESRGAILLLWLDGEVLPLLSALPEKEPPQLFLSASLLGRDLSKVPEQVRDSARIAYPWRLPRDSVKINRVIQSWLKTRKIPETDLRLQAAAYYVGWHLSNALMMMKTDFYRDYLLDVTDMMIDADYTVAAYPRLSFGAGQRYAAKGCYIVKLNAAGEPEPVEGGEWVAH